ncbi:bromodomain-containing protein 4-like isoform X1 [Nylanderia fulva]|uniref:bromodomain-containing protein 4-like isoform X1 n=1 Tax=Nylanderia fulva TaxID=613905 RepID=UPI0010FBA596|nr:bromodomain-containing protein 4-like isoform X1 [Nylanderia fulva]
MNSPLDHDFERFKFSTQNTICKDSAVELLQNFDERAGTPSSPEQLDTLSEQQLLLDCGICGQQFASKKQLRVHIHTHLRKPRIVLRRVPSPKVVKLRKQSEDTYWLDPEKKGLLKLTLKKQNTVESLKLTLKKTSSKSEAFTVVNSKFNPGVKNHQREDVAGAKENDHRDNKAAKGSVNEPFENVMVDQQGDYDNIKFDEEDHNPLEENERPSIDVNEGDSGVGSDMANPSEKEDQNVDDIQNSDNYDNSEKRLSEPEDHEESDALEATCRETIENLKKLGEQSNSRSTNQLIDNSSTEEEDDRNHDSDMIHTLGQNSSISIIPKSSTFSNHSTERASVCDSENKSRDSTEPQSQSFNWNQLSTDLSSKSNEDLNKENGEQEADTGGDHMENTGSLLQNFLLEHQRRNPNEISLSSNLSNETSEYVPLEKLAETVNTCRVCNEKFKDIAHLDEHRSKAGHYQCNIPECSNLLFHSAMEVSLHRAQTHGTPLSPSVNQLSPHNQLSNANSPHMNQNSPHLSQASHSPHAVPMDASSTNSSQQQQLRNSPLTSPHQTNSPSYNAGPMTTAGASSGQQMQIPPINFEQLPPPVQQLAQQVQRMPLPQSQMPPSLPPGANTMIHGPNYFVQPPGRPPLYRVPGPQSIHYPPHMTHLYQYGPGPYPPIAAPPPQMHPQLPQQIPRGRYPPSTTIVQNSRAPRLPQTASVPRQRMKRPIQPSMQAQPQNNVVKQRRMDVLLPDRNEDADCHVIAQQKRNDGLPVIQNVQGATTQQTSRNDSTIHLTDSITLSVRQPGSTPAQIQSTLNPSGKKSDAKAVANVLAARGITVTPAANKNKTSEQSKQQVSSQQQRPPPSQPPLNVTALNLNSAISIIPTSSQRKQQEQGQFAIPQNKQNKSPINEQVERPPRPPTVDLTQDTPPQMPVVRRGRPPRALLTCQVCDKNFQNQDMLTQHMATHRTTSKLIHKCNLCPAQYPTVQALTTHKQTYHKEVDTVAQNGGAELALPVVDLKSPHVLNRLSNLGIQSYIPLSQLSAQTGGYFGLPIITIDGARNSSTCNLGALGATSILSLGPLKHLSNR